MSPWDLLGWGACGFAVLGFASLGIVAVKAALGQKACPDPEAHKHDDDGRSVDL